MAEVSADSKLIAAVSYLWLLSVVVLFIKKGDSYVTFHAKQGLVLFIDTVIFTIIPILGWLMNLVVFIMIIVGFIKALSGEKYKLPIVADIAEKIKL